MIGVLALNGAAVLAALLVAVAAGLGARLPGLLLGTLGGYLVLVHTLVLATGLAGRLTVGGLAVVSTLALAGAVLLVRRACAGATDVPHEGATAVTRAPRATAVAQAPRARAVAQAPRATVVARAPRATVVAVFAALAAGLAAVAWLWPHLFEATRLWVWDDYTYHMVYPTLWLRAHAIAAPTAEHAFTMQAWYPLSADVVATWLMAPLAGARATALAWVSLTAVLYAGIVAGAAAEVLVRLGGRWTAWAITLALFATSGRMTVMASSFADADLAHAAALFAAFAFALPRAGGDRSRDVAADAGYAAALSGIALGIKVSAAVPALVLAGMVALRAGACATSGRARTRALARAAAIFAGAWLATAGYWYARNVVHTGNPVYPAAFLVWPGATFPETTLREYAHVYGVRRAVVDALAVYLNWPPVHATLALVGLAGLAAWLLARGRVMTRPRRYFAGGALVLTGAILLALPGTPYSAGNAMTFRSGFVHWDSMRYVGLLPLLGWSALGLLVEGGAGTARWRAIAAATIILAAMLSSGSPWLASPYVLVALAVCAKIVASLPVPGVDVLGVGWPARGRDPWRPAVVAGGVAVAMALLVLAWHGAKADATGRAVLGEPLVGAAAGALDALPDGTRVAVFGDQWIYPAFGARHHLAPVRLDRDGRVATAPVADSMEPGELTVDAAGFRANLASSDVAVVVTIRLPHPGRAPGRPSQDAALAASGARLLYRDPIVTIWSVGG